MRDPVVEANVREFKRRLARRQIALLLVVVPSTLAFILLPQETTRPFFWPFCGLLVVLAIFDWLTWRCPSCHAALSNRSVDKSCPKCGALFRDP